MLSVLKDNPNNKPRGQGVGEREWLLVHQKDFFIELNGKHSNHFFWGCSVSPASHFFSPTPADQNPSTASPHPLTITPPILSALYLLSCLSLFILSTLFVKQTLLPELHMGLNV